MAANIILTRIDNRLVHGQVGNIWATAIGANLLVVVDDAAAEDKLQQQIMTMTADSRGIGIRFFSVEKTIAVIDRAAESQKIFLVARTPQVIRKLVDGNVPIRKVNVGNMHFSEGKRQFTSKVYLDEKDTEDLRYIASKGIEVWAQDTPDDKKVTGF
ncbi:MAG: PTS N-acetylgalactosamine transporter subunit IIB [Lachnospiraceae bacterium]|nr:PTS N-acetylgalactosamine transporter subunit IIB [Lachnospiraceae bacterium]